MNTLSLDLKNKVKNPFECPENYDAFHVEAKMPGEVKTQPNSRAKEEDEQNKSE